MVLLMSVVPGKGGQLFTDDTLEKIRWLQYYRNGLEYCKGLKIQVDGGMDDFNFLRCRREGTSDVVVGSFITSSNNIQEQLGKLKVL